ncbi:hypothetical protein Nm8I071_36020 [Nonomuraea sp. TT08I-71]|nr:hypothetical protein Nm8I071_36020 [Nonomuraea sp. TT08I-71]
MSELTARLDVPAGVNAPRTARHALVAALRGWGYLDEEWLDGAALVTSELISIAVQHGGGCFEFTVESHDRRVVVSVADGSSAVLRRRDPDGNGGRGIPVIASPRGGACATTVAESGYGLSWSPVQASERSSRAAREMLALQRGHLG